MLELFAKLDDNELNTLEAFKKRMNHLGELVVLEDICEMISTKSSCCSIEFGNTVFNGVANTLYMAEGLTLADNYLEMFGSKKKGDVYTIVNVYNNKNVLLVSNYYTNNLKTNILNFPFVYFDLDPKFDEHNEWDLVTLREHAEGLLKSYGVATLTALCSYKGEPDWLRHVKYFDSMYLSKAYQLGLICL